MGFVKFMSSGTGRAARIIAGLVLIVLGVALGGNWIALSIIGLAPLFAGVFDVCLFGPLLRAPFRGRDARALVESKS